MLFFLGWIQTVLIISYYIRIQLWLIFILYRLKSFLSTAIASTTYKVLSWTAHGTVVKQLRYENLIMINADSSNSGLIVLVGLMGAGKTSIGRRIAQQFKLTFSDTDDEVAKAAGCSIADIFEFYGEREFREGERRVILRLLDGEPQVIATGGGAFMDPILRKKIQQNGISVWLRAELDILVNRTAHRNHRPLLQTGNPRETLKNLMEERYPVYAQAEIIVDTGLESFEFTANRVVQALEEINFVPVPKSERVK